MQSRVVIPDAIVILGIMGTFLMALEAFNAPSEVRALCLAIAYPMILMLFMAGLELLGLCLRMAKMLEPAAVVLKVVSAYRSIGARLPIPYLNSLYIQDLHGLAEVYRQQRKFNQSINCTEVRIAIVKSRFGESSYEMAQALNTLALVYHQSGQTQLAAQSGEQALKIFEENAPTTNQEREQMWQAMNNLGVAYAGVGNIGQALELLNRCAGIKEQLVGSSDPGYGLTLSNIGFAFLRAKEYAHAENFLRKAIAIPQKQKSLTAMMKHNLGEALRGLNNLDEAEKLLLEALSIKESCLPAQHPNFGCDYIGLGQLYTAKGDPDRAKKYFMMANDNRSKNGLSKLFDETTEDYQKFLNNNKSKPKTAQTDSIGSDIAPVENAAKPRETTESTGTTSGQTIDLSENIKDPAKT